MTDQTWAEKWYERGAKVRAMDFEKDYVRSLDKYAFNIMRDKFSFYWSTQGSGLDFSTQVPADWERRFIVH